MKNLFVFAVVLTSLLLITALPAFSQDAQRGAKVMRLVHHDVSPAFRDIPDVNEISTVKKVHPVRPIPLPAGAADDANVSRDAGLQYFTGAMAIPATTVNFEGIDENTNPSCNCAPPDTNASVGPNHIVQTVNTTIAAWNKSGGLVMNPKTIKSLWSGFSGSCASNNDGDPVVAYDPLHDRWVVSQFSVSTTPYSQCIAVSTTGDPTGSYYRYQYSYGSLFNDYPKIGVWADGYYITYNMFSGNSFAGGEACAFDSSKMLTGAAAGTQCFTENGGGLLPACIDGTTLPPSGSPEYVISFATNSLNVYRFHVDWANAANSTFVNHPVSVNAFAAACGGGACIPQPSTSNRLDSLADRLMYRLAYRNFTDHESLVVNHSIKISGNKHSEVDGVRWYELRNTPPSASANPGINQQGTYAPNDGISRWMGSIAMDKQGNMALGFSASSSSVPAGIRYTGRLAGDPSGQMSQGEGVLQNGVGSQTGSLHRWGDYSSMSIDPDGCTFWFTTEYLKASGSFNWDTRIGSFKVNAACN